ncbi:MAG: hypothetical protein FWC59_04050, partial [Actinomycetia bacterium]|nr:hypothetical protein [Actinomycetes bacterium]
FVYVLATVAMVVATFIILIVRFYRMLGDEGYLWFTLPATASQHILAKLIVGVIWTTASLIVVIVSAVVLTLPGWLTHIDQLPIIWQGLRTQGFQPDLLLVGTLAAVLLAIIGGLLTSYAAMAIGPNLTKSRLGGSLLAYLILYIIAQLTSILAALAALPFILNLTNLVTNLTTDTQVGLAEVAPQISTAVLLIIGAEFVFYIGLSVAFYLITRHFLTHRLNLA